MLSHNIKSNWYKYLLLVVVFFVSFSFRFINLGYSEFQDDEKKALIRLKSDQNVIEFFMAQRKGPMQFFVSSVPLLLNGWDTTDELNIRLPFSIIGSLAVIVLYLLLIRVTRSTTVSFLVALLFSVNGFFVGFGRVAQYQNLNLFFSFLCLFLFSISRDKGRNLILWSNLGSVAWALSLLSHWDAIFFLVPIFYYVALILNSSIHTKKQKIVFIISNLLTVIVLLLPFLVPYFFSQVNNDSNMEYLSRRVGISSYGYQNHLSIFQLYNPHLTLYVYGALALLSVFSLRKSWIYILWFIVNFVSILFLMSKPGTHIYNYVIPVFFMIALGLSVLRNKLLLFLVSLIILFIIYLLGYQSYRLFIHNSPEYPWNDKHIFSNLTARKYDGKEVLTFGFPHFRNLKYINQLIVSDSPECRYYISNEGKEITEIYMSGVKYKSVENKTCYYIVKVKRGFIFNRDSTRYPEEIGRTPIYSFYKDTERLVDVYKVDRRSSSER